MYPRQHVSAVALVKQSIEISKFLKKKALWLSNEPFGLILFTRIELLKISRK
jgi:hypothetical protein